MRPPASTTPVPTEVPLAVPIATKLEIPWSAAFLPDGSLIFTERPGRIRLMDKSQGLLPTPLLTIEDVAPTGEGGLLGLTPHPDFARNQWLYVYYTHRRGLELANQVVRFTMSGRSLQNKTVIIDGIPAASIHDGGRIKFGPDGLLYITAGDASVADRAQDQSSLSGKILRLKDDGAIPPDNPFPNSPVYSYGHRNPEGLAWDSQGRLWETEHGSSAYDEVNLIEPGANYGWPVIRGDATASGMRNPVIHSGTDTWAPSGMAFWNGSLYFGGLRGESLYQVLIDRQPVVLHRFLTGQYGRLRDVTVGPDNLFYVLTSNRDGRGSPVTDDDRIIRINPAKLGQ